MGKKKSVVVYILLFLAFFFSSLTSYLIGSNSRADIKQESAVVVNNNGLAWGFDGETLPENPCGVEYSLKEVEMLGNTVNLFNCPSGEAFDRLLSTPYQMSSVIYQGYYTEFERKPWLTTIRSAYHSFMDKYDYLSPGVAFFYFEQSDHASLYIGVSTIGVERCVGPNEDYVKASGNVYVIKGNQQVATSVTTGKCDERISKAESYNFTIKTRE
jgi:hypothetical protein